MTQKMTYDQLTEIITPLVTVTAKKVLIQNHIADRRQVNNEVTRWIVDTITVAGTDYDTLVSQFDTVGFCYNAETIGNGWFHTKKATQQHIHNKVVERIAGALMNYRWDYPEQYDKAINLLIKEQN